MKPPAEPPAAVAPAPSFSSAPPVPAAAPKPEDNARALGGLWWPRALRRHAGEFWLWWLFWNARHFPWHVRWARSWYLWWAWRSSPILRAPMLANARWLLGPQSTARERQRLGQAVLRSFYDFVYEIGRCTHATPEELRASIDAIDGRDHFHQCRALRRGAILVTAHLGSFEAGLAAIRMIEAKVNVLYQRDQRAPFEVLRASLRDKLGVVEVPIDGGLETWARLRDALLRDEVVLMQGDRVLPGLRGHRVPFLGGHILLPAGPVKLAALTGAPLLPVFVLRTARGRVRIAVEEPIQPGDHALDLDHPDGPLQRFARILERYVKTYPEQWLMVQRVWCEDLEALERP